MMTMIACHHVRPSAIRELPVKYVDILLLVKTPEVLLDLHNETQNRCVAKPYKGCETSKRSMFVGPSRWA